MADASLNNVSFDIVSPTEHFRSHYEEFSPSPAGSEMWEFRVYPYVPAFTEGGLWRVVNLTAFDFSGNHITYLNDDDFAAVGVNNSVLFVISVPDYLPPQLQRITFNPTSKLVLMHSLW